MSVLSATQTITASTGTPPWQRPMPSSTARPNPLDSIVTARVRLRATLEAEIKKTNESFQDFMFDVNITFAQLKMQNTRLLCSLTNLKAKLKDVETTLQAERKAAKTRYTRDIGYVKKEMAAMNRYIRGHSHIMENSISTGLPLGSESIAIGEPAPYNAESVTNHRKGRRYCPCEGCIPIKPFYTKLPPDFYKFDDQKS